MGPVAGVPVYSHTAHELGRALIFPLRKLRLRNLSNLPQVVKLVSVEVKFCAQIF